MSSGDTIVAQSTPYGYSGIGVVRMSGSESTKIFKKISRIKKKLTSRIANKASIYKKGDKIDEVMVVWYKAPKSYTGEDVIEISCHGNQYIVESIIEECIKGGAVAAGPGEFTKRAFENNKLELTQVEAIADIVNSETEMQRRFAEFLVFGGPEGPMTQTEAALAAGYSPKRARQEGSELCNPRLSPLVVKYIGELKEERLRKHEVTYEGHIAELARLREAALKKGSFSSAVNAETNRGKAAGLYIDRKIIKTGKLEDMSEEELEAKMKQILDDLLENNEMIYNYLNFDEIKNYYNELLNEYFRGELQW